MSPSASDLTPDARDVSERLTDQLRDSVERTAANAPADATARRAATDLDQAAPPREPLLRWFAYAHLPPHLQDSSRPFADLAEHVVRQYRPSAERSTVLRKLLEAKDAAVRCALETTAAAATRG